MNKAESVHTLVIDDSDFFARMTAEKLEDEHGIETSVLTSPTDAIERFAENPPDCVVSDYSMPELDGIELYERLAEIHGDVPFIVLTGRGDEEVASKAIGAGIDDYLRKLEVVENEQYSVLANRIRNVVSQYRVREKYELLVDNSPDGIAQVSADGEILAANRAMADRFEDDADELVGTDLLGLLPDCVGDQWLEEGRAAIESGEARTFEDSVGDNYYHNVAVPASAASGGDAFQLIARDITEQKEREREIQARTEELSVINRIVRHDICNDVQLLIAWSELLEGHVDEEATQFLEKITDTCDHILQLTENAGDVVEAITDGDGLDLEPMALDGVLAEEVEKKRTTFETATFETPAELPAVSVMANGMLASVFQNLLSNAVRHNDKEQPTVEVDVHVGEETVTVSIADNGPGIPDDKKETIFGRGEMDPESPGSGLGLFLTHRLVDGFGGHVHIEDNDPEGAVFVVELQLADQNAKTGVEQSTAN